MKKILCILMLLCMVCTGAWAGVVISNTPTAVENLSTTKLYAIYVKQCYKANTNAGNNATNVGYLYKYSNTGSRVQATSDFQTGNPLPGAWILTRNSEGGITLRNGYQSKLINVFDLNSSTTNESGFDLGDTAGKYKAVGSAADGYTLQGYDGTNYETPNKAWLNYNTSNGLWVAYAADRAAKFQFFELSITDDTALTSQYVPDGYYYIRTYNDAMYDIVQPYVTDNNGASMRLTAKKDLSGKVGLWHITQVTTDEGNYAYKIQSVQNPDKCWVSGPAAPLSTGYAKYEIAYNEGRKAYTFRGHSTESSISNKNCVTPSNATTFARTRAINAATDDDFYELIPIDAYEVTYNITATNSAEDQISWSESKIVVGTDASAGLAQISYDFFSNFAISDANTTIDEDHTTFNVTANHTLPMVPGKFYLLKNRYTDNHVAVDNNEKTYARSTRNMEKANYLWSFERVENTPNQFYVKNVALNKYLSGTSGVVSYSNSKTNAYTIWKDTQKNTTDGFCLHLSSSNSTNDVCVGSHAAGSGLDANFPNAVHNDGNASLSVWTRGGSDGARKDNGSIFWVEEFDESIFTTTSKYVGDLAYNSTETFETYLGSKTATNLKAALDYYNDVANNKTKTIEIDANKFYVIESACSAFTDGTPRAIYAAYNETYEHGGKTYPDYLKWKKYSADDNSFIFRFQKENHYESGVTWTTYTPTQTATDVYSIYNVAAPRNAYVGVSDYDGRYGMRKRGELAVGNSNNGSARGNDGGIFAVLPIATTNQFAIVARFNGNGWTENKMDCSTMSVKQGSNPTANTASGDVYTYNSAAAANDYHAWRIREVEAPVLEKKAVSISSVGVATFYTGKTLEIPNGVTAKKVVDAENAQQGDVYHLVYEELQDEIPAGTAVVLFGEANLSYQFPRSLKPHDYVVTSAAGSEKNRLVGTLNDNDEATGFGENGTLYALGNKNDLLAFYHFLGETLTAGKAYLDASGINNTAAGGSVRAFAIFDEGTGTVTNIDALTGAAIGEDTAYDLAGRRVKAQAKGISIVNGKKVIR